MSRAINLLPQGIITGRIWRKRLEVALITVGLTLFSCGGVWLMIEQQAGFAETQADQAKQGEGVVVKQSLSNADVSDTLSRVTALNALSVSEVNWPQAVSDVAALVPKDMHLTTYTYAEASTDLTLQMGGQAKTATIFAQFADSLQNDKRFTLIHIDSYVYAPTTGLVSFTLSLVRPIADVLYHHTP